MRTSKDLLVSPIQRLPQSHGILYTHWLVCWASLAGQVFINVPRNVCLVLKMLLALNQFPMRLNFSEIPVTYGIRTVPWYIVSEERLLLLDGFIMESTNSCGYSLSIISCLIFLIPLLKSYWPWHMTLAGLIKLRTTPLFTWCGRLDLNCR
jgi:hypothetical protein